MAETELTVEQRELLTALQAALSGVEITTSHAPNFEDALAIAEKLAECVIDLEWDEDTGALELVGIGGTYAGPGEPIRVCQFFWQDLDDYRRLELRESIYVLIRRAHVIYQNAVGDIKKMRQNRFEITVADHVHLDDTMLADAILNSELDHDLGDVGRRYGKLPPGYKALKKIDPMLYNAGDLIETLNVWRGIEKDFEKDPAAERVYREQSLAYLREIQIEQEEAGIRVDKRVPYVLRDLYAEKREQAIRLARAYVGGVDFNLGSPDDLKHFLYVVEGLPEQRERAFGGVPGKLVTDKDAIAALRRGLGVEWDPDDEPTLDAAWANIEAGGHSLLEARYLYAGAQQALSHYIAPCLVLGPKGEVLGIADRIYPETRLHVQASGRPSIVGPALQQYKSKLLDLICPDPNTVWCGHDWSQIEVRLLAALAQDQPYLDAYARGEDIHEINVRALFGPKGTPELEEMRRRFTKAFVFRLHYRGKPENAGDIPGTRTLGLNVGRLVAASQTYLNNHPAIPEYWSRIDSQVDRFGVVYTFMGRPRRLTSVYRNARYREASNHQLQGGVADIYITTALLVKRAAPWARLVFGAHDSQWWQTPVERRDEFKALYTPIVEREFQLSRSVTMTFPASYKEREAA